MGVCLQWKESSREAIWRIGMGESIEKIQEEKESSERMKEPSLGQGENCLLRTPSFIERRDREDPQKP